MTKKRLKQIAKYMEELDQYNKKLNEYLKKMFEYRKYQEEIEGESSDIITAEKAEEYINKAIKCLSEAKYKLCSIDY